MNQTNEDAEFFGFGKHSNNESKMLSAAAFTGFAETIGFDPNPNARRSVVNMVIHARLFGSIHIAVGNLD